MLSADFEFPATKHRDRRKGILLAVLSIAHIVLSSVLLFFVLGTSQAMKSAWADNLLSLIPPFVFLMAMRMAVWSPTTTFPYGYHRAVSIAFLCASVTLTALGASLLYSAASILWRQEHPSIGTVQVFGTTVWLGWLMIPALLLNALPLWLLGRYKRQVAVEIHDKVLFADADMNSADWKTALAAIVGIVGIGYGYWWADAVAAAVISASILADGLRHLQEVIQDLMDAVPQQVDGSQMDPLPGVIRQALLAQPWVNTAEVRIREHGHVCFAEVFIEFKAEISRGDSARIYQYLKDVKDICKKMSWRVHDVIVEPHYLEVV